MTAAATEEGICLLVFADATEADSEITNISELLSLTAESGENRHLRNLKKQLKEYFRGKRKDFTIPLIPPGTQFQQKVWNELRQIPYGITVSYLDVAKALKSTGAVRAVANANGRNRIAIIIPCHRVIGSDGSLTGYGGGLERKRWLIDHERKHSGKPVDITLF